MEDGISFEPSVLKSKGSAVPVSLLGGRQSVAMTAEDEDANAKLVKVRTNATDYQRNHRIVSTSFSIHSLLALSLLLFFLFFYFNSSV